MMLIEELFLRCEAKVLRDLIEAQILRTALAVDRAREKL